MTEGAQYLILIVDDDEDLRTTLKDFLQFEGYDIAEAGTAEEALEKLGSITPDLIILDMSMPGMGGIAFLKEVSMLEDISRIPVYVFTARSNLESFFDGVDVAGFMAKPCDPDKLLQKIRMVLPPKPSGGAAAPAVAAKPSARKVLLAEDEAGRRESIVATFVRGGYNVVAVSTGLEVVESAIVETPDVLVMKLVMENMNGDAAAKMLSGIPSTKHVPILLYDDTGMTPHGGTLSEGAAPRRFVNSSMPDDLLRAVDAVFES
jgi:CheY-like chemotaxis protein